jgi:hypothetical protein
MHWASWINTAIGLWLVLSPWGLSPEPLVASRNAMLIGVLVMLFGMMSALMPARVGLVSALNALAGLWMLGAPFVIGFDGVAMWNSVVAGLLIVMFAVIRTSHRRMQIV